jgi:hypothetical protein
MLSVNVLLVEMLDFTKLNVVVPSLPQYAMPLNVSLPKLTDQFMLFDATVGAVPPVAEFKFLRHWLNGMVLY